MDSFSKLSVIKMKKLLRLGKNASQTSSFVRKVKLVPIFRVLGREDFLPASDILYLYEGISSNSESVTKRADDFCDPPIFFSCCRHCPKSDWGRDIGQSNSHGGDDF